MVGTQLRDDAAIARKRMSFWDAAPGGLRDFQKLNTLLRDDETVARVLRGAYGRIQGGILVLTDRRLLYVRVGWTGQTSTKDFWLERVSSVWFAPGVLTGRVIIFPSDDANAVFTEVNKSAGQAMVIEARNALGYRNETSFAGTRDPYDQLHELGELHQAGLLTEEEFQTKKADVLDRM